MMISDYAAAAWHGHGWEGGGFFPLFWLVWLVLIVGALVFFWRAGWRRRSQAEDPSAAAERVLAERYARGEVEEDEYRHRLAVIKER